MAACSDSQDCTGPKNITVPHNGTANKKIDSTSETTHFILSYSGSVALSSELVGTDVMVLSVMKPQQGATVLKLETWMKTHVVVLVETKPD